MKSFLVILFFIFSGTLIILESFFGTNFVLNTFHIDYVDIFALSLFLLAVFFARQSKKFYIKHWKKLILFTPLVLFLILLTIFLRNNQIYMYLEAEDSVIEWLQFLFITIISILNFILFSHFKKKNKLWSGVFLFIAIAFFIIAGEEISWGQRIFNITTPEKYAAVNTQQEITLHNYGPIFGYVYMAYMYIGLFASTLWSIKPFIVKVVPKFLKSIVKLLIPGWQYFIYFFTVFLYNFVEFYIDPTKPGDTLWEEPMELLLFIGVTIFFSELLIKEKYFKKKN